MADQALLWLKNHVFELAFIAVYLALIAYHAWKGKQRSRSLDHYLVGGRSLGGVVIALSFYATFVSSVTFVGHSGKSYALGPSWWLTCVVVFTSMVFVAWFVVAPPFMQAARKWDALTVPDFLGHRYQSMLLRRLAGLVVVAGSLAYMVAVYVGAATVLEKLLHLDGRVILVVIFLVVTAYTLAGGFHSVVATDAVQGLILFSGGLILPALMIANSGGIPLLLNEAREAAAALSDTAGKPNPLDWAGIVPLVGMIGLALGVGLKFVVEPRQLSRFYGLSSDQQLRRGRWIAPILLFFTYLFMLPVGFLAHAYIRGRVPLNNTDEVVPYLLERVDLLGPIAGAFFLTALAAAAMSSLDSVLLVAASSIDHDVIAPHRKHEEAMKLTRVWVVILSATAALLTLAPAGIVEMSSFSGSLYAAAFLPSLVVGLFWQRATRTGALASLLIGFAVTGVAFACKKTDFFKTNFAWFHEIYAGVPIALLTYFIVSSFTKTDPSK